MVSVNINGVTVSVPAGSTVLSAAEHAGFGDEIPRFCYHERLGIAGNCRRCLVEIEKSPKPQASCALPVAPNRVVYTNSALVKKARESVREFLLAHHPLDCPICDQGGECDLQDQSRLYGSDRSRYVERKRSVEDKDWGPLVKCVRTRCIQCTRCVRFAAEIAGVPTLGAAGRGSGVEIGQVIQSPLLSELSGNVVDLCPVGALTAAPDLVVHTFRPWEVTSVEGRDLTDSRLTPLRYDLRGDQVRRVLPLDGNWISDKARYSVLDGGSDVIAEPRSRTRGSGKASGAADVWTPDAGLALVKSLAASSSSSPVKVGRVIGSPTDCNDVSGLSRLSRDQQFSLETLGPTRESLRHVVDSLTSWGTSRVQADSGKSWRVRGCNPRTQVATLNASLRERFVRGGESYLLGGNVNLTFPRRHVSVGPWGLGRASAKGQWELGLVGCDVARSAEAFTVRDGLVRVKQWISGRLNELFVRSQSAVRSVGRYTASSRDQFDVQILANVTKAQVAAAGWTVEELLSRAKYNIVIGWKAESWRSGVDGVLPVGSPLSVESSVYRDPRFQYHEVDGVLPTEGYEGLTVADWRGTILRLLGSTTALPAKAATQTGARKVVTAQPGTPCVVVFNHHTDGSPYAESSYVRHLCSNVFNQASTNFNYQV